MKASDSMPRAVGALLIAAVVVSAAYVATFPGGRVTLTGSDPYGYLADGRLFAEGVPVERIGTRVGATAAEVQFGALTGAHPVEANIVLRLVLVLALAGAAASLAARTIRLHPWQVAAVAGTVALWGGVARLAQGYTANLLSLVVFLCLAGVACSPGSRRSRFLWCATLAAVCAFLHPPLVLFWIFVLALVGVVRVDAARAEGRGPLEAVRAGAFDPAIAAALGGGMALAGVLVMVGASPTDLSALASEPEVTRMVFNARKSAVAGQMTLWLTLPLLLGGLWYVRARRADADRAVLGLATGWLLATGIVMLGFLVISGPFWRVLYVVIPVPVLMGIALAALAAFSVSSVLRGPRRLVGVAAAVAVAVAVVGLASLPPPKRGFAEWEMFADEVGAYLEAAQPEGPTTIFYPSGPNIAIPAFMESDTSVDAIRVAAPSGYADRIHLYIGTLEGVEAGTPSASDPAWWLDELIDERAAKAWEAAGDHDEPAEVILFPRRFDSDGLFDSIAMRDPERMVTPSLLVLRGPVVVPEVAETAFPWFPAWQVALRICLGLAVLAGLGAGVSVLWGPRAAPVVARAAVVPAAGVAVLGAGTGIAVAVGLDPGGPWAIGITLALALSGYGAAAALRRTS